MNTTHDNGRTLAAARHVVSQRPDLTLSEAYVLVRGVEDGESPPPGVLANVTLTAESEQLDIEARVLRRADPSLSARAAFNEAARQRAPDQGIRREEQFHHQMARLSDRDRLAARAKAILAAEGGSGFEATRGALLAAASELGA